MSILLRIDVGCHNQHYISPSEIELEKCLDAVRFREAHFYNVLERAIAGKRKAEEDIAHLQRCEKIKDFVIYWPANS